MASTSTSPELAGRLAPTLHERHDLGAPTTVERPALRRLARVGTVLAAVLGAALLFVAVAVLHELLVIAAAAALPRLAGVPAILDAIAALPVNYVYGAAMVRYAGQIEPTGLAVVGLPGEVLARLLPAFFYDPSYVGGSGVISAVLAPGSSVLARTLTATFANLAVLALGVGLALWAASRAGGGSLARLRGLPLLAMCAAAVVQLEVAARVLRTPGSTRDLETLGVLPFIFHQLLRLHRELYDAALHWLSALLDPMFSILVLAGLYGAIVLAWRVARLARRGTPAPRRLAVDLSLVAVLLATLPIGGVTVSESRFLEWEASDSAAEVAEMGEIVETVPPVEAAIASPAEQSLTADAPTGQAHTPLLVSVPAPMVVVSVPAAAPALAAPAPSARPSAAPSVVAIGGRGYRYVYVVDGVPTEFRGMGYNVTHAGLPARERAERLARDFALMRDVGINHVLGWRTNDWDEAVLDAAHAAGIGVVMPYDLDDKLDYADRAVRARVRSDVLAWVARYRAHPAIRMWGLGNETLLHLKQPARARAFAEFYVALVEQVRQADPDHPVVYREAEDVYVRWLHDAWKASGGPPHGFVLGMNFYTFRMKDALNDWPKKGFDVPLIVSEFAPAGIGRGERAAGYRRMWSLIRSRPELVFGAAPYVWNVEGPEPVDRLFGLTENGVPVDSTIAALREMYRPPSSADPATPVAVPPLLGLPERAAERVLAEAGLKLASVARQRASELKDPSPLRRFGVGNVIHQEPAPGTSLRRGGEVRIAVGAPPEARRGPTASPGAH